MEYGEWHIDDMPLPARGFIRIRNTAGEEIAQIHKIGRAKYYGIGQLESNLQKNAHLISAAPDMYEALKAIVERLDKGLAIGEKLEMIPARDALAKAEGK